MFESFEWVAYSVVKRSDLAVEPDSVEKLDFVVHFADFVKNYYFDIH